MSGAAVANEISSALAVVLASARAASAAKRVKVFMVREFLL